jgi:tetratricopeptide (TPR) repeat protein
MPAIDSRQAVELAQKGIRNNPGSWRLYQHLAYTYWRVGQYADAAQTYEQGSQVAGAPPFMRLMAASMKNEGGSRDTARTIYRQMYEETEDEQVRTTALRRLNELDSLDERDAIDEVLGDLKEKSGRCPDDLREAVPMLAAIKLPGGRHFRIDKASRLVDPTGAPYLLDRSNCRVALDVDHTGLPLQ